MIIPLKQLLRYASLSLPLAFAGVPLYLHAPDFYARDWGLSLGMMGTILIAVRLFDAVQDPLIGCFSDKLSHLRGWVMLIGAIFLSLGMVAIFTGPPQEFSVAVWFTISMIFATTGFSIVSINFHTLGALWSDILHERTRIVAWRELVGLLGLLLAVIFPTLWGAPLADALLALVGLYIILLLGAFVFFRQWWRQDSVMRTVPNTGSLAITGVFSLLTGEMAIFYITVLIAYLAASMPAALVMFYIKDFLQAESLTGPFLLLYFCSGALCMPIWTMLSKKWGKLLTWGLSLALASITFFGAIFLEAGQVTGYATVCIASGMALGASLVFPATILADRLDTHHQQHLSSQAFAYLVFIPKFSLAVTSGIALGVLDLAGFVAGGDNTTFALQTLMILYAVVPCVLQCMAIGLVWWQILSS